MIERGREYLREKCGTYGLVAIGGLYAVVARGAVRSLRTMYKSSRRV